jgi:chromosome segregation ATPase
VKAKSLRTQLDQLSARVGELDSQLARAQQERSASKSEATAATKKAAAATAATAELTLRLQTSAAESERRLESLAGQLAAAKAAASAQTERMAALEADALLAPGVESAIRRLREVRQTLDPRKRT